MKEVASYEKEAKDNEAKVQKMRDDGKDPYDIRKQEEVGLNTIVYCSITSYLIIAPRDAGHEAHRIKAHSVLLILHLEIFLFNKTSTYS